MKATRYICLCLIIAVISSTFVPTYAIDDTFVPTSPARTEGLIISSLKLNISKTGCADCYAEVNLQAGYSAEVTLRLLQKAPNDKAWEEIKEWNDATKPWRINEEWFVASGHSYMLELTIDIYNSQGKYIDTDISNSKIVEY